MGQKSCEKFPIEPILKEYFDSWSPIFPVDAGLVNCVYTFEAGEEKYVLRVYAPTAYIERSKDSLLAELDVMALFGSTGVPVQEPIPNRSGELVTAGQGYFAIVFQYIEGTHAYGALLPVHFREMGGLMADMHRAAIELRPACEKKWDGKDFWEYVWGLGDLERDDLGELLLASKKDKEILETANHYCIHGDFHFGNVLFKGNTLAALLDFDNYRLGDAADDIARFFVAELSYAEPNVYSQSQGKIQAFFEEYQIHRPMDPAEVQLLFAYLRLHELYQTIRLGHEKPEKLPYFHEQMHDLWEWVKEICH
ncbi:MAG: phosphotransferase [Patescibacteria group bacterium]|jgi:Ser/Thr protein kinase RdoA (MazF antagonist)